MDERELLEQELLRRELAEREAAEAATPEPAPAESPSFLGRAWDATTNVAGSIVNSIAPAFSVSDEFESINKAMEIANSKDYTDEQKDQLIGSILDEQSRKSYQDSATTMINGAALAAGGAASQAAKGLGYAARTIAPTLAAETTNSVGEFIRDITGTGVEHDPYLVGNVPNTFATRVALGTLVSAPFEAIGSLSNRAGNWSKRSAEKFDPEKKLIDAYNPGAFPDARTQAAYRELGNSKVGGAPILNDPELARSTPMEAFTGAKQRLDEFQSQTGAGIGRLRESVPDDVGVPYGEVKGLLTEGERTQFGNNFRKADPDQTLIVDAATFKREQTERKMGQQALEGMAGNRVKTPLTTADMRSYGTAQDILDDAGASLDGEAFKFNDIVKARQAADDVADWGNKGSAELYPLRQRANQLRDLEAKVIGDSGVEGAEKYQSLLRDYSNALNAQEGVTGQYSAYGAGAANTPLSLNALIGGTANAVRQSVGKPAMSTSAGTAMNHLGVAAGINQPSMAREIANVAVPGAVNGIGALAPAGPAAAIAAQGAGLPPPVPEQHVQPLQGPLRPSPIPVTAAPKPGFAIPRNVAEINPVGMEKVILGFLPEEQRVPVALQWRSAVASGDKRRQAQMLGALSTAYPDFPLQTGPVTGLPSEFDIGDGRMRLFSDIDVATWETNINNSTLTTSEKAQRAAALRRDRVVIPFNMTTIADVPTPNISPTDLAMQNIYNHGGPTPMMQGSQGARRAI